MPNRLVHLTQFLTAAVLSIVVATGCSRSLPTASTPSRFVHPAQQGARDGGGDLEDEVIVTLLAGVDPADIAQSVGCVLVAWSANERWASFRAAATQDPATLVGLIAQAPGVLTAETNSWLESAEARQQSFAFDDGFGNPTTFAAQPAASALDLGRAHMVSTGRGVLVAVLDTGVDPAHPAIHRQYIGGYDFVDQDALPFESPNGIDDDGDGNVDEAHGHGTHVAGIVALTAPEAELLIVRVLDADGRGDVSSVVAGIRYAALRGARVINLSLGMLKRSDAIQNALDEAAEAGITVITSAGNWGAENPREFPASSSHASAVAAVDASAHPAMFTSFSGDVKLSAPGVGIRSAFPGGGYRLWSGTSMSAPFVAGTAALLLQIHPEWNADRVMGRLGATARPILEATAAQRGKLGVGALDAGAALWPDFRPSVEPAPDPVDVMR